MSILFEPLESRTFLSGSPVTQATLTADQTNIVADAAAANAALKTLVAELKTDTALISTDLKTVSNTNAPLLKTLKSDEAAAEGTLKADLGLLLKPGGALVKKLTIAGITLLTSATLTKVAAEQVEITALGSVTTTPLANLMTALGDTTVNTDLQALVTANPGATALANDVSTATGNLSTEATAIGNAATQFAADIGTLTSDLSSVTTAVGTFPNMIGTLDGTSLGTKGKGVGKVDDISFTITSEDAAGNLIGTVDNITEGSTFDLKATITLNGKFAAKLTPTGTSTNNVSILGQFSNGTLTATWTTPSGSGTLSVTEIP